MNIMKHIPAYFTAFVLLFGLQMVPAQAANPCNPCNPCAAKQSNPCSANPCNPCAMKKSANPCSGNNPCGMNPCSAPNPCAMKSSANPCNPCSASGGNTPIREHAFDNFQQAADMGRKMWSDESLGTAGVSCKSCHADYELLNLDRNQNFPHFVEMTGDVVTLDQMINYCMVNPMKGKQFEKNSKELTAMAAYFRAYRMQYLRENRK
jgi:hypothetical protein